MSKNALQVLRALLVFLGILLTGTVGNMYFEHNNFIDALYMTVITVSTVGYGDMVPVQPAGKIFTVLLVLGGVGYVMYIFSKLMEAMVEGGLREILGKRKMAKELARLKNHYIICGYGRIGKVICETLYENEKNFVVIESNPEEMQTIIGNGFYGIEGEASEDDILVQAGIHQAAGLIAVVSTDADNVFITLTARGLNPGIDILARSSGATGSERKLKRAGANRVISPYSIGGKRMAHAVVRPNVINFLEMTMQVDEYNLQMEEMPVSDNAELQGKTLMESNIRNDFNIIVIGIKRRDGTMLFNPRPDTLILARDILIVLGKKAQIASLKKVLAI
ncbi:MAG: potassium channel protein [Proteobacteria bacterium]|nr:potassium channel protein [Pseudomonadota bacterium]MBU1232087.1 potassium channel protein [Pseudomonadota bacterium]MBU1416889.1 potassium channel protein [Pseudomonadota bacterium]MBU1454719.1 potassium channel protein [Pseudomonadota bacterium]